MWLVEQRKSRSGAGQMTLTIRKPSKRLTFSKGIRVTKKQNAHIAIATIASDVV